MAADLKPYPEYRDSGMDWLGEVPAHWKVRQLGKIGRFMKGGGGTKEDEREDGIPCVRYGDLYTHHQFFITGTRACVTPELANTVYTPIRYGDVLFAGSGETIDEIGKSAVNLIPGPACCGGDVIILRPSIDADARFLGYVLDCAATARQKACIGRGFTVVHIYSSDLKYVTVAIPSLPEQAAIVRFLDHADRRIRRYIHAKQRLIALLEEQKEAAVQEAVTGRIDVRTGRPYPAYKDSGNEWLGRVPAHWGLRRLKSLTKRIEPRREPASGERHGRGRFVGSSEGRLRQSRGVQGRGAQAPSYRLRVRPGAQGPGRGRSRVSCERITAPCGFGRPRVVRAFRFAIPTLDEQRDVVRYVTAIWRDKLGRAVSRARRRASLVAEYRARLIADAVTGKLDVREAAERLPDPDPRATGEDPEDDFGRPRGSRASGDGRSTSSSSGFPAWTGKRSRRCWNMKPRP